MTSTGWEKYGAIMKQNEELARLERTERPATCPNDGHVLEDARGVLHCVFGGEIYDYTGAPVYDFQI